MPSQHRRYEPVGPVISRVSTCPPDLPGPAPDDQAEARRWLAGAWADPVVAEAVTLASPALAARIGQILALPGADGDVRRCSRALSGYLTRWQTRATPFGLFAAVGVTVTGVPARLPSASARPVVRTDADWLAAVVAPLAADRVLREKLTLTVDSSATIRDGRLYVQARPGAAAKTGREMSVRCTPAVHAAVLAATRPIPFAQLAGELASRFGASLQQVTGLVHSLTDSGVLISSLFAPAAAADPLGRLLRLLTGAELPHLHEVTGRLARVHELVDRHNRSTDPDDARRIRADLDQMMRTVASSASVLAVDMQHTSAAQLPDRVVDEARRAANLLIQVSTEPFGTSAWMDYHARFRKRYGVGAVVAINDLLADSGLGYPAGFLDGPTARRTWRDVTARDAHLLALIQQALIGRHDEIRLTDADVSALTVGDHATATFPDRIELGFTVHADDPQALASGNFDLHITGAPRSCTSMTGRFAYLLPDRERDDLAATYRTDSETTAAVVSFPPRWDHDYNIVRTGPLLTDTIAVAETGEDATISVDDLAVTADQERFHLLRISTGRRVVARIPHALDIITQTPALARFLAEITESRSIQYGPFSLGATGRVLPYTPRIRYGPVILSPRRWRLTATELPAADPAARWEQEFARWRQRWNVPAQVVLLLGNLHQTADLDRAADRAVIRRHLRESDLMEIREDPAAGRAWPPQPIEFLTVLRPDLAQRRPLPPTGPAGEPTHPGEGTVIHARLTGNPARFDVLLSRHLPDLLDSLAGVGVLRWWTSRFRDLIDEHADQHLTVTIRLSGPDDHAKVTGELAGFCAALRTRRLPWQMTFIPYQPHTARYGAGPAEEAAEAVFASDSRAAAAQIRASSAAGIPPAVLCALSMTRIAAAFGGTTGDEGLRILLNVLSTRTQPAARALTDRVRALAGDAGQLADLPEGAALVTAWHDRDIALRRYRTLLPAAIDSAQMLTTLVHDHHIRAVGVDPKTEQATNRLARAAGLRLLAPADLS
ncbi:lantibiotic dehydratase [Actinoplanes sp. ATCC 53533]|uniref:lantibiotic dehydratase n=1 Tax=Actinoplanes sp. ATCC 53533 TaxID=1288362 RepID=UPI000F7735D1|nr:lantibiotic dehydratase [Actinoplanes sp. ATCC 53533]RSM52340.1 lantibiotic dehydratase [Actinoplanes sp. ATCC 53533]